MIEQLESQGNYSKYIRDLVRADLKGIDAKLEQIVIRYISEMNLRVQQSEKVQNSEIDTSGLAAILNGEV